MTTGVLKSTGSVNMSLVVWVASGFFSMIGDKQKTQQENKRNNQQTKMDGQYWMNTEWFIWKTRDSGSVFKCHCWCYRSLLLRRTGMYDQEVGGRLCLVRTTHCMSHICIPFHRLTIKYVVLIIKTLSSSAFISPSGLSSPSSDSGSSASS